MTIAEPSTTQARARTRAHIFWLCVIGIILLGWALWYAGMFTRRPRFVMVAGEGPYFDLIIAGANEAARQYDAELKLVRVKGDAQADAIRALLNERCDGMAISPFNPVAEASLLSSVAAQTTLVTFDSDSPVSNRLCFVGTDNYAAGRMAGQQVRNAIPDGGEIIISSGSLDKENVQRRRQGVIDELLDRPFEPGRATDPLDETFKGAHYTIVTTLIDPGSPEGVIEQTVKALKDHPSVKCGVGLNTASAPRLITAVEQAGRKGQVQIVGFDIDKSTLDGIEAGQVYSTIMQDEFGCGFHTVRILVENARGDRSGLPMFQRRTLPVEIISKDNVATARAQIEGRPSSPANLPAEAMAPTTAQATPH